MNARDISRNMFDIDVDQLAKVDREAASILSEACRFLSNAFAVRADLDRKGQNKDCLYLEIGENHANPADKIFQILVLKGLKIKAEPFVVGLEQRERTSLSKIVGADVREEIMFSKSLQRNFDKHNHDTYLPLLQTFIDVAPSSAPYAHKTLQHALLREQVDAKFTDAAWRVSFTKEGWVKEQPYIEIRDSKVQRAFSDCNVSVTEEEKSSNKAMLVRDNHSVKDLTDFSQKKQARFALSIGGKTHFFGKEKTEKRVERPFSQSQTMQLARNGNVVIATTSCTDIDRHKIPQNIPKVDGVFLMPMRGIPAGIVMPDVGKIFTSSEAAWVNERLDNLGMAEYKISGSSEFIAPYRQKYEQQKQAFLDDIAHLIG